MLQTYVNAVNEPGAIPVVETSWETSLRILAERFYQEAVEIYKKGMTAGLDACGEEPMEADGGTLHYSTASQLLNSPAEIFMSAWCRVDGRPIRYCSEIVPISFRQWSDIVPTTIQHCSDSGPTLFRHCPDNGPTLFRQWSDIVPTTIRYCSDTVPNMF